MAERSHLTSPALENQTLSCLSATLDTCYLAVHNINVMSDRIDIDEHGSGNSRVGVAICYKIQNLGFMWRQLL